MSGDSSTKSSADSSGKAFPESSAKPLARYPNDSCDGLAGNRLASSLNVNFANPKLDILEAYYRFYVVRTGVGDFDNVTDPLTYNLVDPLEANTVPIPKDGWATMRFVASNPGVWYMHCHFDQHMSWGMDTVFIVRNDNTEESTILPPSAYMPPCETDSLYAPRQ
nr:putative laccase-9 [Quercus suber]